MKKQFLACLGVLAVLFGGAAIRLSAVEAAGADAAAEAFSLSDDFTKITTAETSAIKISGISAAADSTHGAIPSETWGSPVPVAKESYLIYEVGGETPVEMLYLYFKAKVWGQNDNAAYSENAVNVYVGDTPETTEKLMGHYGCADADSQSMVEAELDLSSEVKAGESLYIRIEMIQSKTTCGQNCTGGEHTAGCGTVATSDGLINIWYMGVKMFNVSISAAGPIADNEQPVPNDFKQKLPQEGYVSHEVAFPEIVFTDNIDGNVSYSIVMTDPYNIETVLPVNAAGFLPEYEGIYSFEISASDKAGNTYTDKFSVSCVLADGMPMIYHENFPEKNGRQGREYVLEPLCYDPEETETLDIYALSPDGERIEIKDGKFIPGKVGEYRIVYVAGNRFGTTKLLTRVYVKYDVQDGNVYEMVKDTAHWEGLVSSENGDVTVSGNAYSKLPFDLSEGIKATFVLPESGWMSLNFTQRAGFAWYNFDRDAYKADGLAPGLYVLVYPQTDGYYCDIDYVGLSGIPAVVANHTFCGTSRELTLALKKNANAEDAVQFFINGVKNENYGINYSVKASVCSDNESFTYLSFGNLYVGCSSVLKSVDIYDSDPPRFVWEQELPAQTEVGREVVLPGLSAVDKHDGELPYTAALYAPDGSLRAIKDNVFTADMEGVWYYLVTSTDISGNRAFSVFEIKVGNTEKSRYLEPPKSGGCKGAVESGVLSACLIAAAGAAVLCRKKRKKHE